MMGEEESRPMTALRSWVVPTALGMQCVDGPRLNVLSL